MNVSRNLVTQPEHATCPFASVVSETRTSVLRCGLWYGHYLKATLLCIACWAQRGPSSWAYTASSSL